MFTSVAVGPVSLLYHWFGKVKLKTSWIGCVVSC